MTQTAARILDEIERLSDAERQELWRAIVERVPMSALSVVRCGGWTLELLKRFARRWSLVFRVRTTTPTLFSSPSRSAGVVAGPNGKSSASAIDPKFE